MGMKQMTAAWSNRVKHSCHALCFIIFTASIVISSGGTKIDKRGDDRIDPYTKYGVLAAAMIYCIRYLPLVQMPFCLLNFLGFIFYNPVLKKVALKYPISRAPFICIRVVTRGDDPDMVLRNVYENLSVCRGVGLKKFVIEIVSQKRFAIPDEKEIKLVVVPGSYATKSGILYKPRSSQYCLEPGVNKLRENDWIVHLDEDTLMTEDSVRGILNFCTDGKHSFGQGAITFARDHIVNWLTTSLNAPHVAEHFGRLRLQHEWFHRPVLGFKGSYLVARVREELKIGWDHGLPGSLSDDAHFSMLVCRDGYTSSFIEGDMHETPPLTLRDYVLQRRRWLRGNYLSVQSKNIPFRIKIPHYLSIFYWIITPVYILHILLGFAISLPHHWLLNFLLSWTSAVHLYVSIFGTVKQFSVRFSPFLTIVLAFVAAFVLSPLNLLIETVVVILGIKSIITNENQWNITLKSPEPTGSENSESVSYCYKDTS